MTHRAILLGILAGSVIYVSGIVALCWMIDSKLPHEDFTACCEARGCENCQPQ